VIRRFAPSRAALGTITPWSALNFWTVLTAESMIGLLKWMTIRMHESVRIVKMVGLL